MDMDSKKYKRQNVDGGIVQRKILTGKDEKKFFSERRGKGEGECGFQTQPLDPWVGY